MVHRRISRNHPDRWVAVDETVSRPFEGGGGSAIGLGVGFYLVLDYTMKLFLFRWLMLACLQLQLVSRIKRDRKDAR
ncbi:MAG: hypothetical protein ACI8T1_002299 [Verrucomicrobiales bacterium]|jgi:hypothetical protein